MNQMMIGRSSITEVLSSSSPVYLLETVMENMVADSLLKGLRG